MYTRNFVKITAQLWGNSLGLRIPAPIAREAKLERGSEIDLQFEHGRIVLTPVRPRKSYQLRSLLAKVSREQMPEGDIWGAAMGREVW
jgi:antitoxin MazE